MGIDRGALLRSRKLSPCVGAGQRHPGRDVEHERQLDCRRDRAAELDPDIKIMFITGFAAVALNADSTAPKHAKVLSKPIHLRDLVNEVQKMLAA
jgi:hypothetical protein